jgi:hypothetical protein
MKWLCGDGEWLDDTFDSDFHVHCGWRQIRSLDWESWSYRKSNKLLVPVSYSTRRLSEYDAWLSGSAVSWKIGVLNSAAVQCFVKRSLIADLAS